MPIVKARSAIATVTASGPSGAVSIASSYRHSIYIRHANGTGTITAGATVKVQVRPQGSSTWADLLVMGFGTTASAVETRVAPLPDDAAEVRLDYTAPIGSTGHTLDAEVGQITSY